MISTPTDIGIVFLEKVYDAFEESLHSRDFTQVTRLLRNATDEEYAGAGAEIGSALRFLWNPQLFVPFDVQTSLAKIVVERGQILGSHLGEALMRFSDIGNFNAVSIILKAMSPDEASEASGYIMFQTALRDVIQSDASPEIKTSLIKLFVEKGEIQGTFITEALLHFIHNNNYTGFMNVLKALSPQEAASIYPPIYKNMLMSLLNPMVAPNMQLSLFKLIIETGKLDGKVLGDVLFHIVLTEIPGVSTNAFIKLLVESGTIDVGNLDRSLNHLVSNGKIDFATTLLKAMSAEEAASLRPEAYKAMLMSFLNPILPLNTQISLFKLVIEIGKLDGKILGDVLFQIVHIDMPDYIQNSLIKLLVETGSIDKFNLDRALNHLMQFPDTVAITTILKAMSVEEAASLHPNAYKAMLMNFLQPMIPLNTQMSLFKLVIETGKLSGKILGDVLFQMVHMDMPDHVRNPLVKLLIESGTIDTPNLDRSLNHLIQQGNTAAITNILKSLGAEESAGIPLLTYKSMLMSFFNPLIPTSTQISLFNMVIEIGKLNGKVLGDILFQVAFSPTPEYMQNPIIKLLVTSGEIDVINLTRTMNQLAMVNNVSGITTLLNAMSSEEVASISPITYKNLLMDLFDPMTPYNIQTSTMRFVIETGKLDGKLLGDVLNSLPYQDLTLTVKASLAKLIVETGHVEGASLGHALTSFMNTGNPIAASNILNAMSYAEKLSLRPDVLDALDALGFKAGRDSVLGTDNDDILFGFGGNDILTGAGGADRLYGGSGDDLLRGMMGRDILTGGRGKDTFALGDTDAVDVITDFNIGEGDKLTFSAMLFSAPASGAGAYTVDAAIRDFVIARTVDDRTVISIDADGNGAGKAVNIAVLQNVTDFDVALLHAKGQIDIV